jgi:hypothetical protein
MSCFRGPGPPARHGYKAVSVLWPVVKRLRIEISAVWPLYRPERRVKLDRVEQRHVLERSEYFTFEDWSEIDPLLAAVVELERQRVWTDDFEMLYPMDGVSHGVVPSPQWLDLERWLAGLQERPVLQQLLPMDLGPRFNEPLLGARQDATDALDGIKREYRLGVLIHRMEVGSMVGCIDLHKHPDDDPKKPRQLRHVVTLHRPFLILSG